MMNKFEQVLLKDGYLNSIIETPIQVAESCIVLKDSIWTFVGESDNKRYYKFMAYLKPKKSKV